MQCLTCFGRRLVRLEHKDVMIPCKDCNALGHEDHSDTSSPPRPAESVTVAVPITFGGTNVAN